MAGSELRRSIAEPEHLFYGIPAISYGALAFIALGLLGQLAFRFAEIDLFGTKHVFAIGLAAAAVVHVISMAVRFRYPHLQRQILPWLMLKLWNTRNVWKTRGNVYFP